MDGDTENWSRDWVFFLVGIFFRSFFGFWVRLGWVNGFEFLRLGYFILFVFCCRYNKLL